ncbi:hypothetical protein HK099_001598, partial [Clydaea vesicula]
FVEGKNHVSFHQEQRLSVSDDEPIVNEKKKLKVLKKKRHNELKDDIDFINPQEEQPSESDDEPIVNNKKKLKVLKKKRHNEVKDDVDFNNSQEEQPSESDDEAIVNNKKKLKVLKKKRHNEVRDDVDFFKPEEQPLESDEEAIVNNKKKLKLFKKKRHIEVEDDVDFINPQKEQPLDSDAESLLNINENLKLHKKRRKKAEEKINFPGDEVEKLTPERCTFSMKEINNDNYIDSIEKSYSTIYQQDIPYKVELPAHHQKKLSVNITKFNSEKAKKRENSTEKHRRTTISDFQLQHTRSGRKVQKPIDWWNADALRAASPLFDKKKNHELLTPVKVEGESTKSKKNITIKDDCCDDRESPLQRKDIWEIPKDGTSRKKRKSSLPQEEDYEPSKKRNRTSVSISSNSKKRSRSHMNFDEKMDYEGSADQTLVVSGSASVNNDMIEESNNNLSKNSDKFLEKLEIKESRNSVDEAQDEVEEVSISNVHKNDLLHDTPVESENMNVEFGTRLDDHDNTPTDKSSGVSVKDSVNLDEVMDLKNEEKISTSPIVTGKNSGHKKKSANLGFNSPRPTVNMTIEELDNGIFEQTANDIMSYSVTEFSDLENEQVKSFFEIVNIANESNENTPLLELIEDYTKINVCDEEEIYGVAISPFQEDTELFFEDLVNVNKDGTSEDEILTTKEEDHLSTSMTSSNNKVTIGKILENNLDAKQKIDVVTEKEQLCAQIKVVDTSIVFNTEDTLLFKRRKISKIITEDEGGEINIGEENGNNTKTYSKSNQTTASIKMADVEEGNEVLDKMDVDDFNNVNIETSSTNINENEAVKGVIIKNDSTVVQNDENKNINVGEEVIENSNITLNNNASYKNQKKEKVGDILGDIFNEKKNKTGKVTFAETADS